jgi:hypothetical protein
MVMSAAGIPLVAEVGPPDLSSIAKVIVAGDPNGTPADSPSNRIDPNTTSSPYGGVGSLFMDLGTGSGYLCTGTLLTRTHVLTAGHCVDSNDNGTNDFSPGNVSFRLNYGSNLSSVISAKAVHVNPNFTGFGNPSVNDDLAIIELSTAVPTGVPTYSISTAPFTNIETVTLVGYGTTGNGVTGYISGSASFTTKRTGRNHADVYISDDEGSGAREVFEWDFDGSSSQSNVFGSTTAFNLTMGNAIETTVGGGDSGGPSFLDDGAGHLTLFGVNTFTATGRAVAPLFGSVGGGIVVSAYGSWIQSIIGGVNQPPTANAGADQNITTGSVVQLNGSGSSDPEGAGLTYSWSLSRPAGSSATLSNSSAANPTFIADVSGQYVATLVVSDGANTSAPDSATINAAPVAASVHVGDIDGSAPLQGKSGKWSAKVTVRIHNSSESPVAGATVTGRWSGSATGTVSGVTDSLGNVSFSKGNLSGTSATFAVTNVSAGLTYNSAANHDPDGDSTGTSITLARGVGPVSLTHSSVVLASAAREIFSFAMLSRPVASSPVAVQHDVSLDELEKTPAVDGPRVIIFSQPEEEQQLDLASVDDELLRHALANAAIPSADGGDDVKAPRADSVDRLLTRHARFGRNYAAADELAERIVDDRLGAAVATGIRDRQ